MCLYKLNSCRRYVTVVSTGSTLQLDWKPVTRDCFFYAAAIGGIVGTFYDGKTSWWEGAIYVACYCGYIVTMMYNVPLMEWMAGPGLIRTKVKPRLVSVSKAPLATNKWLTV